MKRLCVRASCSQRQSRKGSHQVSHLLCTANGLYLGALFFPES